MKRSSQVPDTPKKRRKYRAPHSASPQPRDRTGKGLNLSETKASSELFQAALEKHKTDAAAAGGAGADKAGVRSLAAPTLGKQTSSPENLVSVIERLSPPATYMDDIETQKKLVMERIEVGRKKRLAKEEEAKKAAMAADADVEKAAEQEDSECKITTLEPEPEPEIAGERIVAVTETTKLEELETATSEHETELETGRKAEKTENQIENQTESHTGSQTENQTDSQAENQAKSQTGNQTHTQTEPMTESKTETKTESKTGCNTQPKPEPKTMNKPVSKTEPKAAAKVVETEQRATTPPPRQGSGSSIEDAMDVDASPSTQLNQEAQQSHAYHRANGTTTAATPTYEPASVVSSEWLIAKLSTLSTSNLDDARAAIVKEIQKMSDDIARMPRAEPAPPSAKGISANGPRARLLVLDGIMRNQSAGDGLPPKAWSEYRLKLTKMCESNAVHGMDYRQRLEKVKEIVYLPEEMALLRTGDAARMAAAIRLCAAVAELTGADGEGVPEEMVAWVDAHIKDAAWKAKVTNVWRKYSPPEDTVMVGLE